MEGARANGDRRCRRQAAALSLHALSGGGRHRARVPGDLAGTGRESLIHAGGPWVVRHWQPSDDSEAIAMIGSVPPVEETITEATRWMVESGLVKGAQPVGPNG